MPMCSIITRTEALTYAGLLALLLSHPVVWGQSQNGRKAEPLRIPNRAPAPLFEGQQVSRRRKFALIRPPAS